MAMMAEQHGARTGHAGLGGSSGGSVGDGGGVGGVRPQCTVTCSRAIDAVT